MIGLEDGGWWCSKYFGFGCFLFNIYSPQRVNNVILLYFTHRQSEEIRRAISGVNKIKTIFEKPLFIRHLNIKEERDTT